MSKITALTGLNFAIFPNKLNMIATSFAKSALLIQNKNEFWRLRDFYLCIVVPQFDDDAHSDIYIYFFNESKWEMFHLDFQFIAKP